MSFAQFQFRRGTASAWTSANPTLAAGEMGIETDTAKFKIGDGSTVWTSLAYGGIQGPQGNPGTNGTSPNAFTTISGNSGSAVADNASDTLTVTGTNGLTVTAADTPDSLTITPTFGTALNTFAQGNDSRIVGAVQTARSIATTAPLTGGGDLSADRTLAILAATTAAAGSMSGTDKKKLDALHYDVTANSIATLVGDDSTDNLAAWNTLFAGLPVGATVYFPPGTYRFSGDININADKHLRIRGAGKYSSIIKTTSATANGFNINGVQAWYNTFEDLRFETTANKTAGAAILISTVGLGANKQQVGINIYRCSFSNWFKAIYCVADDVTQGPGNLSVWDSLDISIPGTTGSPNSRGIHINGAGTNLVLSNSTINMGYPPFQVSGTACIEINASGAIQLLGGEFIGGTNTLLLNASSGGTTSIAAVYATNCFFDQSAGSTVKITGGNVTNRCKFVQCGITTGNVAGGIAVEIASTGTGAAGTATAAADGINFIDCDLYPNGGSGTINGFQITGAQGVSIQSSRISGFTNGVAVTPAVANGYTKIFLSDNKLGATNNFTTPNTVGLLLNAGSFQYGGIVVTGNDFSGSTTPITDSSTLSTTGQKIIGDNLGLPVSAFTTANKQALTTVDTVINQIPIPANSLRVGTTFRITGYINRAAATASILNIRARFGTAGTNADAQVILLAPSSPATANTATRFEILVTVRAIGNGTTNLTANGHTISQPNNANQTAAYTASFTAGLGQSITNGNSTVANFLTLTIANATSSTTDVYVTGIEVIQQ